MQDSGSPNDSITAVPGISVGHWTNADPPTGCTVVLCDQPAVAAVDVRGGAPATRETDLLRPGSLVERVHAVLLSGGSAFGLDAATGVMRWLEERQIGFPVTSGVVPIVPAAALYDFTITSGDVRPAAEEGYQACDAASNEPVTCGSIGAGAGATVGKLLGAERCIRGGLGSAAEFTDSGIAVGVMAAVNALGEIVDPETGAIVAGIRGDSGVKFASSLDVLRKRPPQSPFATENSTLVVVATDVALTRDQGVRVAVMAQTGLARTIRPVHTPVDGDIVFALATGANAEPADALQVGALAARAVERAVLRAVREATSYRDTPSVRHWVG